MADVRHRLITEGEKHDPKGFTSAGDYTELIRDENGVSRYKKSKFLEDALSFVDGNAAPPTEVLGAIYVVIDEGNGAVDAAWDGASYNEWLRYNGVEWVSVAPTEGVICYDATANFYKSFDGTDWGRFIPEAENISNADLTWTANRVQDLAGFSLTFDGGTVIHKGDSTSGLDSQLLLQDSTGTDLWDFRNDGGLIGSKSKVDLIAQNATNNDLNEYIFRIRDSGDNKNFFIVTNDGFFTLGVNNNISGGDYSACGIVGNINSITGTGGDKFIFGGKNNITGNASNIVILGTNNTATKKITNLVGYSLTTTGEYNSIIGFRNNSTANFCSGLGLDLDFNSKNGNLLGRALSSEAVGASIIGNGISNVDKLVNNTSNSLALGWDVNTPQHLFYSGGAYIGGGSPIASEDISLQGDVLTTGSLTLKNSLKHLGYTSSTGAPTVTELPNDKDYSIHKDTSAGTVYLAYNDGGTIKTTTLT